MKIVIVSDAHIKSNQSKDYELFCDFIKSLFDKKIDTLILLGDIFDFLYSSPRESYYHKLYDLFDILHKNGTKIIYLYGNHDFNFSFNKYKFIKTVKELNNFKIDNYNSCIYHGDGLDNKDFRYKVLKTIIRSKLFYLIYKIFPKNFIYFLADYFSKKSRKYSKIFNSSNEKAQINEAKIIFNKYKNINLVIFAHTHNPIIKKIDVNNITRTFVNTGSFMQAQSFVSINDGFLTINKFV